MLTLSQSSAPQAALRVSPPLERAAVLGFTAPTVDGADVAPNSRLVFRIHLAMRGRADAEALARSVSDPHGPRYEHYLSSSAWRARFSPTADSVARLETYLRGFGLQVTYVPANRLYLQVVGTPAQISAAFRTPIESESSAAAAEVTSPSLPLSLAPLVIGMTGELTTRTRGAPDIATQAVPTGVDCSDYWGQRSGGPMDRYEGKALPLLPCGYSAAQMRSAYGVDSLVSSGIDGNGQTVVIVGWHGDPSTLTNDLAAFRSMNRQSAFPGQLTIVRAVPGSKPQSCDGAGWAEESRLDVESVDAMAPAARIVFVASAGCHLQDLYAGVNQAVDQQLGHIVSLSWGKGETELEPALIAAYDQTLLEAAATGVGVFAASGDTGDHVGQFDRVTQTAFPASSPWVTAVGGTSLGIGRDGRRVFEVAWGTDLLWPSGRGWTPPYPPDTGSGGGMSVIEPFPWYQRGATVPDGGRNVPDIAMEADPLTSMVIARALPHGAWEADPGVGGTSAAAPLMAGLEALADDAAGRPHGFATPAIYALRGTAAIVDVVTPATVIAGYDPPSQGGPIVAVFGDGDSGLSPARGWDPMTGLGVPDGEKYVWDLGH